MVERDSKYLFLVPSKPDWVVTNGNGAFALSLCDGSRTIDEIVAMIAAKHSNSEEAKAFLEYLHTEGFFDERSAQKEIPILAAPRLRSVHLNMSADCNLVCNYCYAEERVVEGSQLSADEYISLIGDLASMTEGLRVAFTGGEPLLNKNTQPLAAHCREKGMYTYLLTNGIPIVDSNVQSIANSFDEIRISIDGSSAHFHDFHRGMGTYDKTMAALRRLDKHGANVRLAMTVTKQNIGDIAEVSKMFGSRLMFQPLFNAGNAKLNDELAISGEAYFDALSAAGTVAPMAGIGATLARLRNRGTTKCAIGDAEISISHSGDVFPCHMMHLEEYKAGNIRNSSIKDIYANSPVLRAARRMSVSTRAECSECPVRLLCGGTCRARAYYLSGNLDATDDFCDYEFAAFIDGLFQAADMKPPPGSVRVSQVAELHNRPC